MSGKFTVTGNSLDDVIAATLWQAMRRHDGNQTHAAADLGITRWALRRLLARPPYNTPPHLKA